MSLGEWQVHSHHLNIDVGDCTVHLLVRSGPQNGTFTIQRAVLADGGTSTGGDHIKSFVHFVQDLFVRYNKSFKFFHTVLITHWDRDHRKGLEQYFEDHVKACIVEGLGKPENKDIKTKAELQKALDDHTITPSTVKATETKWFAPHTKCWEMGTDVPKTNRETQSWRIKRDPNYPDANPPRWTLRIEVAISGYGVVQMPMGEFIISGEVLARDMFFHEPVMDPKLAKSPEVVCQKLREREPGNALVNSRPAMVCVASNLKYLGDTLVGQYKLNLDALDHPSAVQFTSQGAAANTSDPDLGSRERATAGIQSIPGTTTPNNLVSIICMVFWPGNTARVSHYLGGDAGDEVEDKVLLWATKQIDNTTRKPIHVEAMKLSHHGAKFSTPLGMIPAWDPKYIVCSNGMSSSHNHPSWPTVVLIWAWYQWRTQARFAPANPKPKRLYAVNYPVYLTKVRKGQELKGRTNPGDTKHLRKTGHNAAEWRKFVLRLMVEKRESDGVMGTKDALLNGLINELDGLVDSKKQTNKVKDQPRVVDWLNGIWNNCSAIGGEQYLHGPSPRWAIGSNYADQVIRAIEVVQTPRPEETAIRGHLGKVLDEKDRATLGKGAWDFFWKPKPARHHAPGEGEKGEERVGYDWEELEAVSDGDTGSVTDDWEDDLSIVDKPAPSRRRQQKPLNNKTVAPFISHRADRRPLGVSVVSPEVADVLNRNIWGDRASAFQSSTVSEETVPATTPRNPPCPMHIWSMEDPLFYVVTTTHLLNNNEAPINKAAAELNTPLDLMLEQLKTGALVLSKRPTDERATVSLDDSDESLQFFRDIFSPVSDDTCTIGVDVNMTGTGSVAVHGFEASVDLTDLISPATGGLKRRAQSRKSPLVFKSTQNAASFDSFVALGGGSQPAWVTGGTASNPDCIGPAQMVLMSLAPDLPSAAPVQCTLDEILRLVGMKDNGIHNYFTLDASFQLSNGPGSRNSIWFIPQTCHTATLRLVFKPADESLLEFRNSMLKTVREFTGLEHLDVTEPQIIAKRTWKQAADSAGGSPPTSDSELGFMANIQFGAGDSAPVLQTALVIEQNALVVAVSFVGKDPGLKPKQLLDFVANTFLGTTQVPLNEFFPSAVLDNVRLLRVVYQVADGTRFIALDFQINWASLELKVTITYDLVTKQFGLFGRLFPENRPEKLPAMFSYLPYMPDCEPWTVLQRASFGTAAIQSAPEGMADLGSIYRELTKGSVHAQGEEMTTAPFQMQLVQLNWSYELSIISFSAVVGCPRRDPSKKYNVPPFQFTGGQLDLKFDCDTKRIRRVAVGATFTFRVPPKPAPVEQPKPPATGLLDDQPWLQEDDPASPNDEEEDPQDPTQTCPINVLFEYEDQKWTLATNVQGLSGTMLYSIFDDDCNTEVAQLLKNVRLDLGITYQYDSSGEASRFRMEGALYVGSLELSCTYTHGGEEEGWHFFADVALKQQKATLLSLVESLFDIEPGTVAVPSWLGGIKAEANALTAAEANSLASLELASLDDHLVVVFRFKLTDGSTLAFYQIQEKKNKKGAKPKADDGGKDKDKDPAVPKKPKRVLALSVDGLPQIPPIPMIGTIKQPFETLDFLWVLDGNEDAKGLTRADIKAIHNAIDKSKNVGLYPRLRYKDTIKEDKHADGDALLAPGFHFVVSNSEKVMLDYAFGGKDKKKDEKKKEGMDEQGLLAAPEDEFQACATATAPMNKKIGPVTLLGLGFGFDLAKNTLSIALDGTLELGPLAFTLIGLELSLEFTEGVTLRSLASAKPTVTLRGLGAAFERDPILLAGLFERGEMENGDVYYQGAATIGFTPWVFRAAGLYGEFEDPEKKKPQQKRITQRQLVALDDFDFVMLDDEAKKKFTAFLVYCSLEGPLMTIGYAEIRGLSGGVGYNTSITMPTVDSVMRFPFLSVPKGTTEDTDKAQGRLMESGWFGIRKDSYWVAAGVTVMAFQMLHISAVVVVEWNPSIKLGIFGVATAEMPRQAKHKFARVQLALAATLDVDAGILRVDGQLTPASFILDPQCHLTGGFALYSWFGTGDPAMQGSWVFTIGGYHPRFIAPAQFPVPPRLGISWSFDDHISITGEAYFAITPKCCMGGGRLHVTLSLGPLYAYFDAYADFLIQYRPFHFETEGGLSVGVRFTLDLWLVTINIAVDIAARLYLEGPPVRGIVHVDFWVFGFDIAFGKDRELANQAALPFEDFYDLVLQADAKQEQQPAAVLALAEDEDIDQATAPEKETPAPVAAHTLSCTSGLVASDGSAAPAADAPWRVRGAIFAFSVACKFVFDRFEVETVVPGQESHTYPPTPKTCPEGEGRIYARPMGLGEAMHSSKVTVTVTRLPTELLFADAAEDFFEETVGYPVWEEVQYSVAALPTALWGNVVTSNLLDGTKDAVVSLPNALSFHAPGAKRSKDKIEHFDLVKSMGQVVFDKDQDPEFPDSESMSAEWDPATALEPPMKQYDLVKEVWKERNAVAEEFVANWCKMKVFGWVEANDVPLLSGTCPTGLADGTRLEAEYTEAPRVNLGPRGHGQAVLCF